MIEFVSFSDVNELNTYVAKKLWSELSVNCHSAHFLPTGNTYLGIYREFLKLLAGDKTPVDLSELTVINLDEYVENGLPLTSDDSRSFAFYMQSVITALQTKDFQANKHIFPHSLGDDKPFQPYQLLNQFDNWLKTIDVASAFLGLGPKSSPHIAFCSPQYTDNFDISWQEIGAYVAPVDEATRKANADNHGMNDNDRSVPSLSCTISAGTLWQTKPRNIYLVAYGKNKDLSVIESDLDVGENPASVLKKLANMNCNVEIITID